MDQVALGAFGAPLVGVCGFTLLMALNALTLMRYLRRGSEETASGMSLLGWGLSFLGYCLGPCGVLTAVASLVIASMERGKVSREEVSAWTLLPCQATRTNAILTILAMLVLTVYSVVYWFWMGQAAAEGVAS